MSLSSCLGIRWAALWPFITVASIYPEKLDALNKWMDRLELISVENPNVTILKVAK
ncbi:Uncharacterised protein [Raoultella terrigena]|uniref:Uncharacterized protein n=1 Tax=Raoultella terrigena TaxID=577 RepID=A0A4V6J203_RAOTE|nr:Uncharacterised protein [Raoultella terrigena]